MSDKARSQHLFLRPVHQHRHRLSSSFFLPKLVGWGKAAVMCSKNKFGLRMTRDAFNAALKGLSLEDANRMEDRNQALIIANAIAQGAKELG